VGLLAAALFLARAPLWISTALIAGASLLVVMAVEPAFGLIVMALAIPFGPLFPIPVSGVNVVDLLVVITIAMWLARGVAQRNLFFRAPPLTWSTLAFVWVCGLSLTQAVSWREGLPEWLKWVEYAAVYLVAAQILLSRRAWWVVGGLLMAGVLEAGLGVYQFLRQVGPQAFVLLDRFMRAYGTFAQPNPYAGYLGYLAPVALSLALCGALRWRQRRRPSDLWIGLVCTATAAALIVGIGVSWSRGSWLGLAAASLLVLGLHARRAAASLVAGFALLALALLVFGVSWLPEAITARLGDLGAYIAGPDPAHTEITDANFAVLERLAHWQSGLRMFTDHPWLGVGIGNYAATYSSYALPHWYQALGHAHNIYVNLLAETGLLGALAFAVFWLSAAWQVGRIAGKMTRGDDGAPYRPALAIGVLGTLTYLTVHSVFDNLFVQHMQLQLALLLGSLLAPGATRWTANSMRYTWLNTQ